jgi:hypothetical protein
MARGQKYAFIIPYVIANETAYYLSNNQEASELLHSVLDHLNILTTTGVNFPLSTFKIEVFCLLFS